MRTQPMIFSVMTNPLLHDLADQHLAATDFDDANSHLKRLFTHSDLLAWCNGVEPFTYRVTSHTIALPA